MIVTCGACGKRYNFDVSRLKGRTAGTVRCANCKTMIRVSAPDPGDQTTRLEADANLLPTSQKVPGGGLGMPPDRRLSLAVLQGKDSGKIFAIDRTTVTLGRGDADIILDDPEISRHHACIEVHGARVVLKDLGSTNGTFVNDVKISQCQVENRGEFRVGGTRLMLIMTETEPEAEQAP